jgi:hypothetical protein
MIAHAVADTPFRVYDRSDRPIPESPMQKLIDRPSSYTAQDTSTKLRSAYFIELLLGGSVLRAFTEMAGEVPMAMYIYPRWMFTAQDRMDENGLRVPLKWSLNRRSARSFIANDEIYHDALYNPFHEYEGMAPLEAALLMVANDVGCSLFTNRYFSNDASSGLILSSDDPNFDNKAALEAQKMWDEHHAGASKAFGTKFVGHGLKPHSVGKPFDANAQSIVKSLTKEEIVSGIFRIPLEIFGASNQTGGGVVIGANTKEPAYEGFLVNVVVPWAKFYDDEWNNDVAWRFGSDQIGKHDFSENPTLENRRLERAKTAATLMDRGVPLNEVIRWLHLNIAPQAHGDEWFAPNWLIPASVIQKHADAVYTQVQRDYQKEAVGSYVESIVRESDRVAVRIIAAQDERCKLNGRSQSNASRIAELMDDKHDNPEHMAQGGNGRTAH